MSCITKDSFRSPVARRKEKVEVPECGEGAYVYVLELGAQDIVSLEEINASVGPGTTLVYDMLSRVLVDDEGQRIWATAEELKQDCNLPFTVIKRLEEEVLRFAGVLQDEKKS